MGAPLMEDVVGVVGPTRRKKKPKVKRFQLVMEHELFDALHEEAEARGISASGLVRFLILKLRGRKENAETSGR